MDCGVSGREMGFQRGCGCSRPTFSPAAPLEMLPLGRLGRLTNMTLNSF